MDKPKYVIDVSKGGRSVLESIEVLTKLDPEQGRHKSKNYRPPKALYNTSISRVSERVMKCCEMYEKYFIFSLKPESRKELDILKKDAIDSLEFALYAAAEHVDDLKLIAQGFFDHPYKAKSYRKFINELDEHRDFITKCVNQIKHHQSRLRGVMIELIYGGEHICLHGVFIEGVSDGVVGPDLKIHSESVKVLSATTIIWEIIVFILRASRSLRDVIIRETNISSDALATSPDCEQFRKAVSEAAKLPLYTLDDKHPFSEATVTLVASNKINEGLDSELTGSLDKGWPNDNTQPIFLRYEISYQGDGMTSSFKEVFPSQVGFSRWS